MPAELYLATMAPTKRKRKHRGTPAGTIEARGRTGRPPAASEVRKTAAARRQERMDRPPTWKGAVNRAAIAADVREAGGGPQGVRAIGLFLPERGRAQVSLNVHDPTSVPLVELVTRVRERAPVAEAELVGLAPRAAFAGFPDDVPLRGFDPERHLIEEALASLTDGADQA